MKKIDMSATKALKPALIVVPLLLLLGSCFNRKPEEKLSCDLPTIGSIQTNSSDNLDISVNIDGSGSMIGYVSFNDSNYIKTINAIESVVDNVSNTNVSYNRIGDQLNQAKDRQLIRAAKRRDFYDGSNPSSYEKVSSPIQEAIQPPVGEQDKLTIIVTDLEGDDGDYLSETIRKHYFNPQIRKAGYTVGVWAIKTQFRGNVYDPETSRVKFVYDTTGKSEEEYRPFYVLFIGKYGHIANYLNQIKNLHQDLVDNSEMLIFPASNVVKQEVTLGSLSTRENQSQLPDDNQLVRSYALDDANISVYRANEQIPYEFLEIVHQDNDKTAVEYSVNVPMLTTRDRGGAYALPIDSNQLRFQTKVFTFDPNLNSNNQPSQTQSELEQNSANVVQNPQAKTFFSVNRDANLQNILTIANPSLNAQKQQLDFTAQINVNNLSNTNIHLFEVDLIMDNLEDPSWWNDWDYGNGGSSNDGSKTENISLLMKKLEQLSLDSLRDQNNNAVIGRLCFAIQKNL